MMNTINQQELMIYTARARADKAINSLKGILLGIQMDGVVNIKEINELHQWAVIHNELIDRNPFNEFMTLIQKMIENQLSSEEAIEDLYWLCQKYESDNYYYDAVTADMQTLQGLCHGILSDGEIHEREIFNLHKWLNDHEHLSTYYPYDEIRSLILSIVSDHKVDEEEKVVLQAYFKQFVQLQDKQVRKKIDAVTSEVRISGLCTSNPQVSFDGTQFCITGVLQRGTRAQLHKEIRDLGGILTNSVSQKTDYLIVGDNGNPAWAFACYGRKVEKALNLRKEGHSIMLIHEYDFFDILEDFDT